MVIGGGDGRGDGDGEMAEERAPPGLLQVCAARTSGPQEAEEPDAETRARRRGPRSYHVAAASPESRAQVVDPHFQLLGVVFVPGTPASNLNLSVLTVRTSRQHVIQFNSSNQNHDHGDSEYLPNSSKSVSRIRASTQYLC